MRILNLGVLAHVDAGKTSLSERLLYAAGVIDEIGRVDDGTTQTDTSELERERGITIKNAVVSFVLAPSTPEGEEVTVNLIDTPGHPDFIAEVERVLGILDGAVLVVSAVEGVQAQTRVLMRALQRLQIPTLIFVNKIDRRGADSDRVLDQIEEMLTDGAHPMGVANGEGSRAACFVSASFDDGPSPGGLSGRGNLVDLLADHDDSFLAAYVERDSPLPSAQLWRTLSKQTQEAVVFPVYLGSAVTGAGVEALMSGLTRLLPTASGDADAPARGSVFKIERGPAGEKIAYVRMFEGTLRTRSQVRQADGSVGKITAIRVFTSGSTVQRPLVTAGQIGLLRGLPGVRIGDRIGAAAGTDAVVAQHHFLPPSLETVVAPVRARDRGALHLALTQLAEQDPLINVRQDDVRQEISVSLYGEVQKEVIQATLAGEFGLEVTFRESTTICVERPLSAGEARETMKVDPHPFLATVGLRIDPAPLGTGVAFALEVELGSLPMAFLRAIEEAARETLLQGLHGWEVTDCTVTLTTSGYAPRQSHAHAVFDKSMSSTAGDFRGLTPLVVMAALQRCGTEVDEPLHRFRLDLPADTLGAVLAVLGGLEAVPQTPTLRGYWCTLEGDIAAARVHQLQQQLPSLTRGEGVLESSFDRYQRVRGPVWSRPRIGSDPRDRKAYLLQVERRGFRPGS